MASIYNRQLIVYLLFAGSLWHTASAQDESEQILQRHFQAIGQDLWNQISDVTIDGRWVNENHEAYDIQVLFKAPDKVRIDGTIKKPFIEAYNGTYGWILAPWKKDYEIQRMTPLEELLIRNSFGKGSPLYQYKDDLRFLGLVHTNGKVFFGFGYEDARIKKTFYLDQKSYHIAFERIVSKEEELDVMKRYEKFRSLSGLGLPTAVRYEREGIYRELVFDEIFIGLGIRDDKFDPPKEKF